MEPRRVEDLHLDRVVASQPEIGPTPPDGGYGWLVLASAMIYQITIPGLLIMYGFIILKSLRDEDHEDGETYRLWDVDIAMVPILMVVIKLLLESWARTVVKLFNMPRFMALSGLCLTVAGVLLSSYSTDPDNNDNIMNVFAGICAGSGCALTGQQTEVIITHYFRDKLMIAQRLLRIAPSIGNCIIPVLIGYLSTQHSSDVVVLIYGAIVMQNCFFLASFSRPVYVERVIRNTYNMLRDAVEDEDEVIFSNAASAAPASQPGTSQANDDDQVVVFRSTNAKEVMDPEVERREERKFSSDFGTMVVENRFSSDFSQYTTGYEELRNVNGQNPEPLYRETTVNTAPEGLYAVNPELVPGSARRTASLRRNFITLKNMLSDVDFYLYTLLHLCTTFSVTMLGVTFPPLIWVNNTSMNVWGVAALMGIAHAAALCMVLLCIIMPKSLSEKSRLCAAFCAIGALGFYGITLSTSQSFIVVWGMFASFATSAAGVLQQPIYNNILNEFDTTATITAANTVVATFIMVWSIAYNYQYRDSFVVASVLQLVTSVVFVAVSFKKRR